MGVFKLQKPPVYFQAICIFLLLMFLARRTHTGCGECCPLHGTPGGPVAPYALHSITLLCINPQRLAPVAPPPPAHPHQSRSPFPVVSVTVAIKLKSCLEQLEFRGGALQASAEIQRGSWVHIPHNLGYRTQPMPVTHKDQGSVCWPLPHPPAKNFWGLWRPHSVKSLCKPHGQAATHPSHLDHSLATPVPVSPGLAQAMPPCTCQEPHLC